MTDYNKFNALEINCIKRVDQEDSQKYEVCPLREAELFSVYGSLKTGGTICLKDCETRFIAEALAQELSGLFNLPVIDKIKEE
jgi:hypothetical protein